MALLTARALPALLDGAERWRRRLFAASASVWALVTVGVAAAVPLLQWWLEGRLDAVAIAAAAAALLCAGVALHLLRSRREAQAVAAFAAAAVLVFGVGFGFALPRAQPLWLSPQVAAAVRGEGGASCPRPAVAAVGYAEPSLVFLVGTATKLVDGAAAAQLLLSEPCALAVVADQDDGGFRGSLARLNAAPEAIASFAGLDYSKGRRTRLTIYRVAAPPPGGSAAATVSP